MKTNIILLICTLLLSAANLVAGERIVLQAKNGDRLPLRLGSCEIVKVLKVEEGEIAAEEFEFRIKCLRQAKELKAFTKDRVGEQITLLIDGQKIAQPFLQSVLADGNIAIKLEKDLVKRIEKLLTKKSQE